MSRAGTKPDLPGISVAIVGPRGCGKTTALGQLCKALNAFEEEAHSQCRDLAKELGRPYGENAWMLDRLLSSRERGETIESGLQSFNSEAYSFTALDTPGNEQLSHNMLSITSLSDVAILVVSAVQGEFEESVESGRTRELALACFTMGIKSVAVWVTKMDDASVQFASARFEEIRKSVNNALKEVGYKQKDVPFVPISGLTGENLVGKPTEMSWYTGPSVIETLDSMGPINRPAEKPLRLPVLKVRDISGTGTVVVGRVETGSLRVGLKVCFSPGGYIGEVRSLQKDGQKVSEAKGGDIVGVAVSGVQAADIKRGLVMSFATNDPAADAETFLAQVIVLDHPGEIRGGYCPSIAVHTAQVPCEFEELLAKIDRKTGKESETNPLQAVTGEVLTVKMRPKAPVCVEPFSAYPSLGRFAIRDHGRTVAVGVIKEVTKRAIPKPRSGSENQYFDGS